MSSSSTSPSFQDLLEILDLPSPEAVSSPSDSSTQTIMQSHNPRTNAPWDAPPRTSNICKLANSDLSEEHKRFEWIGKYPYFTTNSDLCIQWKRFPIPATLVLVGIDVEGPIGALSSGVWICHYLIESPLEMAAAKRAGFHRIVLTFFCERHKAVEDPLNEPSGMLRSLISQLLSRLIEINVQAKDDIELLHSSPLSQAELRGIKSYDTKALIKLFQLLVQTARRCIIHCFIDRVPPSKLESVSDETYLMIADLHRMLVLEAPNSEHTVMSEAIFKLMITASSNIQPDAKAWFSRPNFLTMDDVRSEELFAREAGQGYLGFKTQQLWEIKVNDQYDYTRMRRWKVLGPPPNLRPRGDSTRSEAFREEMSGKVWKQVCALGS